LLSGNLVLFPFLCRGRDPGSDRAPPIPLSPPRSPPTSAAPRPADLSRGDVSDRQLQAALDAQRCGQPRKIGEWLQVLQFATERQVLTGLSVQWTLPLLSSPEAALPAPARLLPTVLRRELRLVPVRHVEATNELYLATWQRVE
jgi:hypothetical protein